MLSLILGLVTGALPMVGKLIGKHMDHKRVVNQEALELERMKLLAHSKAASDRVVATMQLHGHALQASASIDREVHRSYQTELKVSSQAVRDFAARIRPSLALMVTCIYLALCAYVTFTTHGQEWFTSVNSNVLMLGLVEAFHFVIGFYFTSRNSEKLDVNRVIA
jgi:hypothetical protein